MLLANLIVEKYQDGGPIMHPILVVAIVALAVVTERAFWWIKESFKRDAETLEKVLAAMENGDFRTALGLAKDSADPVIRMIYRGLSHVHGSLTGALQVAAGAELKRAGRFLMLKPEFPNTPVTQLHVIVNWAEELKRRVPRGPVTKAK